MKFAVAGYCANLLAATPTSIRLAQAAWRNAAIEKMRAEQILHAQHGQPVDAEIAEALAEIDAGHIVVEIDKEFIRAKTAQMLMSFTAALYNADWTVITNETPVSFVTSDNPLAFEDPGPLGNKPTGLPRYLPLSPRMCLYIVMGRDARSAKADPRNAPKGSVRFATTSETAGVALVNELVVKCAEDLVISTEASADVADQVVKYAKFMVDYELILQVDKNSVLNGTRTRVWDPNDETNLRSPTLRAA